MVATPTTGWFLRFAERLRFRTLFFVTAGLFVADLIIPDFIPLADEILLGLATLLLGSWRKKREEKSPGTWTPGDHASH